MDPYRDSAAPAPVKKLITKTWKVDFSAFIFAVLLGALCVLAFAIGMKIVRTAGVPEPCEEKVKIITYDNDDRTCGNGGHFVTERMGDNTHVLVRCVCGELDAGAAR